MFYFAYGSNMPTHQILRSDSYAKFVGKAELTDYKLDFTRFSSKRKCGVADVVKLVGGSVWGVLWEVSEAGWRCLDIREGVSSNSYRRISVTVLYNGVETKCFTYEVVKKKPFIPPNQMYMDLLLEGSREHELPDDYIAKLSRITIAT